MAVMTPTSIANRLRPTWGRKFYVDDHQQITANVDMT
jgi:hypothetical protein